MDLLGRMRMRALASVVALGLVAWGVIVFAALPALPVIGVAVAAAALVVNQVAARLDQPLCRDCGRDLSGEAPGTYGVCCPACGLVNQFGRGGDDRIA